MVAVRWFVLGGRRGSRIASAALSTAALTRRATWVVVISHGSGGTAYLVLVSLLSWVMGGARGQVVVVLGDVAATLLLVSFWRRGVSAAEGFGGVASCRCGVACYLWGVVVVSARKRRWGGGKWRLTWLG